MQVMGMVMVTLGLALGGILRRSVATHVTALGQEAAGRTRTA